MKKILITLVLAMPMMVMAQTETDRVAALQAEAAAKAKAAQEAAKAAQEAARAAQEAAEAAAAEAAKASKKAQDVKTAQSAKQEEAVIKTPQQETKQAPVATPQAWSLPEQAPQQPKRNLDEMKRNEKKAAKAAELAPYVALDAVPVVNGDVQWELNVSVPGKSAQQLYDAMLGYMTRLTQEEIQLERSKVAIVNESEHSIVATLQEWLTFTSNFISLDRTKFNYVLIANCKDGGVQVLLNRISYEYTQQGKTEYYKAEDWITDKYAVNKKRTRLYPITGKFRRKTIDRKNEIFQQINATLQAL